MNNTLNPRFDVIQSFVATREGACDGCGLPGRVDGLMSVPGFPGHYCCIECVECRLFGPGKCRWCGFPLDPNQSAFCCEKCRALNGTSPFGSGRRFAMWLSRHHPRLFAELAGQEIPAGILCLECGDSLDGKRQGSRFCSSKCRKRFSRSHNNPANAKKDRDHGHQAFVCATAHTVEVGNVQSF
jgi:hypothetical protein